MTDSDRRRRPNDAPRPHRNDTPEEEYALSARAENQEPQGPPRRPDPVAEQGQLSPHQPPTNGANNLSEAYGSER
jgi:hypothetical protein